MIIKFKHLNENKKIIGEKFRLGLGQIISAEENRDMPSKSTLNEKLSDLVGETSINLNENIKIKIIFY